jgi:oligopeptidase B
VGRIKKTDLDVPARDGGYFYYNRTEQGKQYRTLCRRKGSLDGPEEVVLDLDALAEGRKFLSLGARAVSDDGRYLAYSLDVTGGRQYVLAIKDLDTVSDLSERIAGVESIAWSGDDTTVFYVTEDAAKRPHRVFRHRRGTQPKDDALVYEEKDELYRVRVSRSRDKSRLYIVSQSSTTTEQRAIPADRPEAEPVVIVPRQEGHEYHADHRAGLYYILTNQGAREFRLVTAPAADPQPANWVELVAARPGTTLRSLVLFRRYAALSGSADGLPFLELLDLEKGGAHRVVFPEPVYSASLSANHEFDTDTLRYVYQSLVTPQSVYDYDILRRTAKLLKRTEVLGGFDPANYVSERIFATAGDDAQIPINLVARRSTPRDGTAPLLLSGYGAYGISAPATFNASNVSLLDRGVICATAQIRGGGDLGKAWHDAGKMEHKKNTFTDFIACADHLVASGYTRRDRLAIRGGSAGGLLIGAVCNIRPDLCKAAVLEVPFVDVLNTMSDPSLPLTIQEYLEWGNPNVKAQYDYIKTYSPYDNIAAVNYPAMLVRSALNDSQVPYWEPAKYVARMRATRTDREPLLLKMNMDAGHGGASGRYDSWKESAFVFAFLLERLGIND